MENFEQILHKYAALVNKQYPKEVCILPLADEDRKCNQRSDELRTSGNTKHNEGKFQEALKLYTKSLLLAEANSRSLALGYGNRSASLFELGFYKECIEDVDRALSNKYPSCFAEELRARKRESIKRKPQQTAECAPTLPSEIQIRERSKAIECAANCVEIKEDETMGRCVMATRDIRMGEIIAVEKSFASVFYKPDDDFLCHECWSRCMNPVPCLSCHTAVYCKETCRRSAWNKYHRYECKIRPSLSALKEEIGCSLKIALSIKDYKKVCDNLVSTDSVYRSDRLREVLQLPTAIEKQTKSTRNEVLSLAAKIVRMLKDHTKFFDELRSEDGEEIFKGLIVHLLHVRSLNSFWLFNDSIPSDHLYAFVSLFNHSCVPNVIFFLYGTTIVIKALEDIKKGKQLFISYCADYATLPKPARQSILSDQYYFECDCPACEFNWPVYRKLKGYDIGKIMPISVLGALVDDKRNDRENLRVILGTLRTFGNFVKPSREWETYRRACADCLTYLHCID